MSVTGHIKTVLRDRRNIDWLFHPEARVGYLGWVNRGNLGDEAMYVAHRQASPAPLRAVPLQRLGWSFARRGSVDTLVLGGGTLLCRREWTSRLEVAVQVLRPSRLVSLGVGVEEPTFALAKGLITQQELNEQVELLSSFDRLGVRGPRSVASLASLGLQAEMTGDPALALDVKSLPKPQGRRLVIVSLAAVKDGYAEHAMRMRTELLGGAHALAGTISGQVVGLAMEHSDISMFRTLAPGLPVVRPRSVDHTLAAISSATIVIGERLHANILAARLGVPFIAVGYKPKTYDFTDSIDASSQILDSRALLLDDVVSMGLDLLRSDLSHVAAAVADRATQFRTLALSELA